MKPDQPLSPELQEAFEAFWKAYPRRRPNPKAIARRAFARLVAAGVDAGFLERAAGRFAIEARAEKIEAAFVPHARTWLLQRRFEDYPDPALPVEAPAPEADGLMQRLERLGLTTAEFTAWIEPLDIQVDGDRALARTPSRFIADRVRGRYLPQLRTALGVTRIDLEVVHG